MTTKCIIVDDEPLAIEVIASHLSKISDIEVVAECDTAVKAFEILQKKDIDLIFLDIQMPEITGLEFLKTLKNPPKVIITTAYRKYAIDGYELDVLDFLLKPVSFERLLKAIDKYYKYASSDVKVIHNQRSDNNDKDIIYVKENKKIVRLELKDILFIESLKDYVVIHTVYKKVITKISISALEKKLPAERFLRIHRSYIAAVDKIDAFTPNSVEIGKKELTIGRSYKNTVMKSLGYSA